MKNYIMAMAFCLHAGYSFAQDQRANSDTLKNIELPAAIVRTNKSGTMVNSMGVSTVTRRIPQVSSLQDLPYALDGISSVVLSSDAGAGTGYTGIRIRGADLTRINVTLNGVPVNDAESQATYFVNTPDLFSSTKSIEITKGVGSSKNGVGNFGASIAVNNLDVDQVQPTGEFQVDYGSFNSFKQMLKLSTGLINQRFVSTLRLSNITSDGYIQRSASKLQGLQFTSKYLLNRNTQVVFNYMNGHEKTGQAWNGVPEDSLQTNRTFNELGLKSDGSYYNNQTDNYGQQYYQLFIDKKLRPNLSIGSTLFYTKGKGYYEEYKLGQSYSSYGLSNPIHGTDTVYETDLIRQLWLDNDFYGGRVYANYSASKFDAGLYLNYNEYKGRHFGDIVWAQEGVSDHYRWYKLSSLKKDFNVYGMMDYKLNPQLRVFADMQVRKVDYLIHGFRKNPTIEQDLNYLFFNPKARVTWYKNSFTLFTLMTGIAQKEPNRDDVEAGISSFPKPEKMLNIELTAQKVIKNHIGLNATFFMMQYRDQLVLTGKINDVGAYTRSNVPNSFRRGIELEGEWNGKNRRFKLKGNVAISQNKINEFSEFVDDYDNGGQIEVKHSNTDISFSPSLIAGAQFMISPLQRIPYCRDFTFILSTKYVGKQYLDNTSNDNRSMSGFGLLNLHVDCPIQFRGSPRIAMRAGIDNILNKKYVANGYSFSYISNQSFTTQNYYFPQAGRRYSLGLGVEF